MKWKRLRILLLPLLVFTCGNSYEVPRVEGFDISPDGRSIIYAFFSQGRSTVNLMNLESKTARRLLTADAGYIYQRPRFFGDTAFTVIALQEQRSQLFLTRINGGKPREVATGNLFTEAAGLPDRGEIYFFKANVFTKYSSMVKQAPHNMDLYSINIESREFKRITNLNAYQLGDMDLSPSGLVYFRWYNTDSSGVYSMQLDNCCILKKLRPKNPDANLVYHTATMEKDKLLFFSALYFIYRYDAKKNTALQLHSAAGAITRLAINKQKEELIYSIREDSRLFFVDFAGNAVDTIDCGTLAVEN